MMLFDNYPRIVYPLSEDGKTVSAYTLTDISTRINLNMSSDKIRTMTESYSISHHETPEHVSMRMYNTPYYYWVIMYVNSIFDYLGDWLMTDEHLLKYCASKYGEDHINDPRHYEDEFGIVVMPANQQLRDYEAAQTMIQYPGPLTLITNYLYEAGINERKRVIRVVKRQYMTEFLNMFKEELDKLQ